MSKNVTYAVRRFTIQPGETVQTVRDAGFVTCLNSSGMFKIAFNDGPMNDFEAGLTYRPESGFERIALHNSGISPVTVRLGFGKGNIADSRVTIGDGDMLSAREPTPDRLVTDAPVTAVDGAANQIAASDPLRREIMVVSPASAAGAVYIGGDPAAVAGQGIPVLPGQSLTLQTTAAIYARNDTGAPVALHVAEMGWSA